MIPAGLKARARPGESAGAGGAGGRGRVSAAPPPCPSSAAPFRITGRGGCFLPAPDVRHQVVHTVVPSSGLQGGPAPSPPLRAGALSYLVFWLLCSALVFAFVFAWCLPVCLRPNSLLCQHPGHIRTCCCLCCQVASDSVTPWTAAHQAALSMVFPRQEYWNGLPFPPAVELPHPGTEPVSPELRADSVTTEPLGKPSYQIGSTYSNVMSS